MAQAYTDRPTREAWNALEESIVTGTYTGDGERTRTIELGFTPRAVLVMAQDGATTYVIDNDWRYYGGLALPGVPVLSEDPEYPVLAIVEGGFRVYSANYAPQSGVRRVRSNYNGAMQFYIAVK